MNFVPDNLLRKWERDAFAQGVTARELPEFLRSKEMMWRLCRERASRKNESDNNLLDTLGGLDPVSRVLRVARAQFLILREEKDSDKISRWWSRLRENMRIHKISKDQLRDAGLSWSQCQKLVNLAV